MARRAHGRPPASFDQSVPIVAPAAAFTPSPARSGLALDATATVLPVFVPTAVNLARAAGLPSGGTTHTWSDHHTSAPINPPTTNPRVRVASTAQASLPSGVGPGAPVPNGPPAPTPTPAPNLVTNPGFETGDTTGYTARSTHEALLGAETYMPHTGTYELYFGTDSGADGYYYTQETLTQSVATTNGRSYLVSFYLNDRGTYLSSGTFDVTFGGATVLTTSGISATNGYVQYSATVAATAATSDLTFSYLNEGTIILLDDLSVTALPVPEPATWAGGALLLGATVLTLRRRRAAAARA